MSSTNLVCVPNCKKYKAFWCFVYVASSSHHVCLCVLLYDQQSVKHYKNFIFAGSKSKWIFFLVFRRSSNQIHGLIFVNQICPCIDPIKDKAAKGNFYFGAFLYEDFYKYDINVCFGIGDCLWQKKAVFMVTRELMLLLWYTFTCFIQSITMI